MIFHASVGTHALFPIKDRKRNFKIENRMIESVNTPQHPETNLQLKHLSGIFIFILFFYLYRYASLSSLTAEKAFY